MCDMLLSVSRLWFLMDEVIRPRNSVSFLPAGNQNVDCISFKRLFVLKAL